MKKRLIIVLILFVFVFGLEIGFSEKDFEGKIDKNILEKFNSGEEKVRVIVRLDEDVKDEDVSNFKDLSLNNLKEKIVEEIGKEKIRHQFKGMFSADLTKRDIEKLIEKKNIKQISYDYPVKSFLKESIDITNASLTWSLKVLGINLTGVTQTVCVIDTGVDFSHPDLTEKNLTCNIDCISGEGCVENCSITDDNGHGTHVAGIVGASGEIFGIARETNLIGIKVLDVNGNGYTSDVIAGIDWCINNSLINNISVISMSLGCNETIEGYPSYCDTFDISAGCGRDLFTERINNAVVNNISVVVATGNENWDSAISSPACIQNATPISSVNKDDNISDFSNRNFITKLFAPGHLINSTMPLGDVYLNGWGYSKNYSEMSGTSMATPMVAGAIAIINQYLSLSGQTKTPSEVEDVLYDTGVQFNESSNNFSRIDVYSAILSLDIDAPNVILVSPTDNHINLTVNQTFICNATDWQLANVTLKVWNSMGLYCNATNNLTGTANETSFDLDNMSEGTYLWNCLVSDVEGNLGNAANYTLTIGGVVVNLTSPENNSYTNVNETDFVCNLTSEGIHNLSNVTFYLWNSTGDLINTTTKNINGISNGTIFNWTFIEEDNYLWNCLGINNASYNSSAENNFTIIYDTTPPLINLSGVADGTSTTIEFSFDVSDSNPVSNCSVYVDGNGTLNTSAINNSGTNLISVSGLNVATHNAYVNCTDGAGNVGNSSTISFTINSPPVISSSSGGSSSIKIYSVDNSEMISGYSVKLKAKDKISFGLASGKHSLKVLKVESNSVDIIVESEPIYLTLTVGEEIKLNLSSPNYYDFYVKLNEIKYSKANISVMRIFEEIVKEVEVDESNKEENIYHTMDSGIVETEILVVKDYFWVVVILVIVLISVLAVVIRLNRKKLKTLKSKKKRGKKRKNKKHGKNKKAKT